MRLPFIILGLLLIAGCSTLPPNGQKVSYTEVGSTLGEGDSLTQIFIKPYKKLHDSLMNQPLGYLAERLEKKQSTNTLWNFAADVLMESAPAIFNEKADAAFINGSGLRIPYLPQGALTKGRIYELMPFENYVMMVKMRGTELQKLADHVVRRNGDPISGMSITGKLNSNTADLIIIGGMVMDTAKIYNIVTLDFTALYAGIKAFENPVQRHNSKVLYRQAIENYVTARQKSGKLITANADTRVILY